MIRVCKKKVFNKLSIFQIAVMIFASSLVPSGEALAYNTFYPDNDILFYNSLASSCQSETLNIPELSSGYARLKEAVKTYGQAAMDMQREYGVPWEVVFAQMQTESQTGTAGHAVQGATNNWLGITGSGDDGYYVAANGRHWARYTSVSASIMAWGGPKVLRNGYYDDAFAYLDPNNYNLDAFLTRMISHYAPSSDGNDEIAYKQNVLGFINGPIQAVRLEMGWPSSAELAKNESIAIGGKHPVGVSMLPIIPTIITVGDCAGTGMSEAQAIGYMNTYENSDGNKLYAAYSCSGYSTSEDPTGSKNKLSNCVAVASYFIQNNTNLEPIALNNGGQVVSQLIEERNFIDGGNKPQPYAIFSTNRYGGESGHTGVVLGIDGNNVIIFEEGCSHKLHKDGDTWVGINTYPMSEATSLYTYAYPPAGSLVGLP